MKRLRTLPLLAAPLTLAAACSPGGETPFTPAPPPPPKASSAGGSPVVSGVAELLPADAVSYLELASLQEVDALLREGAKLADDPMAASMARVDALLPMLFGGAGKVDLLDRSKPVGAAFAVQGGEPTPFFFLPCIDADGFATSLGSLPGGPTVEVHGDYVVVAPGGEYHEGGEPHPLATGLLDETLALRVDVAAVAETLRPVVGMGMSQVRGMALAQGSSAADLAALQSAERRMDQFWSSAETIDLGLSLGQGSLDLSFTLAAKPGSELAGWTSQGKTQVRRLARYFSGNEAFQLLVGTDAAFFSERVEPLFREVALQDDAARTVLPLFSALRRNLGSTFALGGGFEDGVHVAMYCKPRDAESFHAFLQDVLTELDEAAPYMELATSTRTAGELTVREYAFATPEQAEGLDAERLATQRREIADLFGDEGLRLRVADNGEHLALELGGSDAAFQRTLDRLAAAEPGGELAGPLAHAFDFVGDANPSFVASLDLARLATQGQELVASMTEMKLGVESAQEEGLLPPTVRIDRAVPMTYYGAIEGRLWRFGMTLDVAGLAELVEAFGPSFAGF